MVRQLALRLLQLISQLPHCLVLDLHVKLNIEDNAPPRGQKPSHHWLHTSTHLHILFGIQQRDATTPLCQPCNRFPDALDAVFTCIHWPEVLLDVHADAGQAVHLKQTGGGGRAVIRIRLVV